MLKKNTLATILLPLLIVSVGHGQNGWPYPLSFSRPGVMMNIPTVSLYTYPYLLRIGVSGNYLGNDPLTNKPQTNYGLYLETDITRSFRVGFSAIQNGQTSGPQISFHVVDRLLTYGETAVGLGVEDITFNFGSTQQGTSSSFLSRQGTNLSYFLLLSRESTVSDNHLRTYIGIGTGRFSSNFGKTTQDTLTSDTLTVPLANSAGIFVGFSLTTGFMADQGGVEFLMEWDGTGVNVGARIPFSPEYKLAIGITNLQNLPKFGQGDIHPPAISLALDYYLPRLQKTTTGGAPLAPVVTEGGIPVQTVIDSSWHKAQEQQIILLQDSLRMSMAQIENLNRMIDQLEQRNRVLQDSVAALQFARHVSDTQINLALKHLSRSLRLFYNEKYEQALAEVNQALELNPNLALAYARRGSIYYKMGDLERATINWNLALQIDPAYDEVRNILKALNENRLRTAVAAQQE